MRHYLKFAGLFYGSIALVPIVLGLLSALPGFAGLALMLLVFGLLSALVALAIGAVVFVIHGVRCAKQLSDPLHRAIVVLAGPVLTVAVLLAMTPLVVLGHYVGDQANRKDYRPYEGSAPPIIVLPAPAEPGT